MTVTSPPGQQPDLAEFKAELEAYLNRTTPRVTSAGAAEWGTGPEVVGLFDDRPVEQQASGMIEARGWRRDLFDAGFGWLSGPPEYGGRGLTKLHDIAYARTIKKFVIPHGADFKVGLGMVAPTIMTWGTEEQKRTYLRRLHRADLVSCQLFSEPEAGSDLAAVRTLARRDGDSWIVQGQKVWTSMAHCSDIGMMLARTDTAARKHAGLTMFIVDMREPGVEVRPLRQMTGGSTFNEVFLDEVVVPDGQRLGPVNGGWAVAMTTLSNERFVSTPNATVQHLVALVRRLGLASDPMVRHRLADVIVGFRIAEAAEERHYEAVERGEPVGLSGAAANIRMSRNMQAAADLASDMLGYAGIANTGEWGTYSWTRFMLSVPGAKIGGGTDEVLKNILAERVLGLSREPRR